MEQTTSPTITNNRSAESKPENKERRRKRWHRFEVISPDRAILRGSRSTMDHRFKAQSRGRQESAASAVALVCARLIQPRNWTGSFVDLVLDYADRLYRVSKTRAGLASDEYMTTGMLHDEFFIGDYKCRICVESGIVFGNLRSEAIGAPCFGDGLKTFFMMDSPNFGVLTSQGISVAVWSQPAISEGLFYFDPAPTDEQGKRSPAGSACLMRFREMDGIVELFQSNLDLKFDSRYCIDKVSLISVKAIGRGKYRSRNAADLAIDKKLLKMQSVEEPQDCKSSTADDPSEVRHVVEKLPLKIEITNYAIQAKLATEPLAQQNISDERYAYDDLKVNVPATFVPLPGQSGDMILHGWSHEGSEAYKAKGAQSVANCVMAIGTKKVHPVRTWLRKTLDEVLAMGDAIFAEVRAAKPSVKTMTAADLDDARFKIEGRKMIVNVDLLTVMGTVVSKSPTVLSLKQGLEEFFVKNIDGVLECSSEAVAVWTQDDYFYLFDSKSCDAFGLRVLVQKKGGKKGKDEAAAGAKKLIGKCCVIRFSKLISLCRHLLKSIDSTKSNDRFTIRRVEIVDEVPGTRAWNSFKPAAAGKSWILRGNLNSEDESFDDKSRGVQGLAMHLVALLSARTTAPANWSREDVDDVVREGDAYYNWCIPAADETDDEEKVLDLRNLKKILYYKKCKVVVELEESCVVGDLRDSGDSDLPSMALGINRFFDNHRFGLVESNKKYFAIWKFEEELIRDKSKEAAYYLFHDKPDERFAQLTESEAAGKVNSMACVLRYLDPNEMAIGLTELLQSEEENSRTDFFIHEVKVASISEPMTDEEIEQDRAIPIRPELKNYSALGETGAFLAGSFRQSNENLFKRETRGKQQAASALVTLAMTKLFDPHLWYPQVLDDILKLADKLTEENSKNIPENDEEEPESAIRDYLLPSEVVEREFFIGVNEIAVDVEEETASGKLSELAKTLQEFFDIKKMAIFRYEQIMLPIWKEGHVFFTMDPRGKQSGTATAYWYLDLQSLTEFLLEVQLENADGDFAIDSVSIENKYTEAERSPENFVTDDRWYNFVKVSEGHWKIDCNVSLTDEMFAEENRGKHISAAVCVMAIVFSKVYEPPHWSVEILDEITVTGEKLHSRSAVRLGENKFFQPNEIISEFFLADRRIDLRIHDCVEAGTLGGRSVKIPNISSGLSRFFKKSVAGCVTIAKSINLTIWLCDHCFYCLEPGASLARFEDVSLLAHQLLGYGDVESDFEITSVDVVDWNKLPPWKFDPSPAVRPSNLPPLNAYSKLPGRARAILRGFTHQASDVFCESIRGRQTAANCVISLAMAVIKNPTTWTRKTLDQVLAIGTKVHCESQKYSAKTSTLKAKDIVRIFSIGANVLAADVEERTITGIVANPPAEPDEKGKRASGRKASKRKSSAKDKRQGKAKRVPAPAPPPICLEEGLYKFFENNNAGILVTGRFMVAIWKDNGVYFMYDPRPRNEQGLKDENDKEAASCVVWFACMEPLYELISANVNDDEKYAKFEISRVIVRTVSIEPLPCPAGYTTVNETDRSQANDSDCPMPPILAAPLLQQPRAMNVDLETSFERIDRELSVLLASSHMSSRAYPSENRGYQSCAISAVAIVVSSLHAPSTWTPELIDAILKHGDVLHTECARLAQPGSRNLAPSELLRVFVVGDVRARICLCENLVAGISLEQDLASALRLFFDSNASGILHTANYSLPVIEHWGAFYALDASDRNRWKKDAFDGVACLIKCESAEKLAKIVIRLFAFEEPAVYTLNAMRVLDLHFFTR